MIAGRNARFIPGQTHLPDRLRRAMDVPLKDQRTLDFPDLALGLFADMKLGFKTERDRIFIFSGPGAGGWKAAITNTLPPGDRVLAARFGQFSQLWIDLYRRRARCLRGRAPGDARALGDGERGPAAAPGKRRP